MVQPSRRRKRACSIVSIPSTTTRMRRLSAERGNRAHDRHGFLVPGDIDHEGPVDLDRSDPELADIGERRIAGAKVVEREADAHGHDAVHGRADRVRCLQEVGFGDLEGEPGGRQAGVPSTSATDSRRLPRMNWTGETLTARSMSAGQLPLPWRPFRGPNGRPPASGRWIRAPARIRPAARGRARDDASG